jgi:hypothetical protein
MAVVFLLVGTIIGMIVGMDGGEGPEEFGPGDVAQSGSYVIFKLGQECYSRNGLTGALDFSGSNATAVIQSTINAMNEGGSIVLRNGSYEITNTIQLLGRHNLTFRGEGWATRLIGVGDHTILRIGSRQGGGMDVCSGIRISDLNIDGSKQTKQAIAPELNLNGIGIEVSTGCDVIHLENLYIYGTGSDSIYGYYPGRTFVTKNIIEGHRTYWGAIHVHAGMSYPDWIHPFVITENIIRNGSGGIKHGTIIANNWITNITACTAPTGAIVAGGDVPTNEMWASMITGNYIFYAKGYTGSIHTWDGRVMVEGNCIVGGTGYSAIEVVGPHNLVLGNEIRLHDSRAIRLTSATECLIANNIIEDVARGSAVRTPITLRANSTYNQIVNNHIYCTEPPYSYYGIEEESTLDDFNIIERNIIRGVAVKGIVTRGANTTVNHNVGFLTENSILSTPFAVDSTGIKTISIAHGLDIIPAMEDCLPFVVEDTPVDDWAYDLLIIASVDATNVTVKIDVSNASSVPGATAMIAVQIGMP